MSSNDETQNPPQDADIFSRGSLEMTSRLLKTKYPELAEEVQALTEHTPLPKTSGTLDNPQTDFFKVEIDSRKVRTIVEALTEAQQSADDNTSGKTGMTIMARSLLEQWIALAAKMLAHYNVMPEGTYTVH